MPDGLPRLQRVLEFRNVVLPDNQKLWLVNASVIPLYVR